MQLQEFLKSDHWLRRYCIFSGGVFYFEPPCTCIHTYIHTNSGKSGPKDQVALHYYYTSPSHWRTTHEVSKLQISQFRSHYQHYQLMASAGTPYRLVPAHFYPCIQTLENAHNSQPQGLNLRRGGSLGGKRAAAPHSQSAIAFAGTDRRTDRRTDCDIA